MPGVHFEEGRRDVEVRHAAGELEKFLPDLDEFGGLGEFVGGGPDSKADVDGDGLGDIAYGTDRSNQFWVLSGADGHELFTALGPPANAYFGAVVAAPIGLARIGLGALAEALVRIVRWPALLAFYRANLEAKKK